MIFGGLFGTNPWVLEEVLESSDLQCTPVTAAELVEPGLYMVAFWNNPNNYLEGAHYVTVEVYDDGGHKTYNGEENHPSYYADGYIYGCRVE